MGVVTDISVNNGVRLVRRYGLDAPVPRRLSLLLAASVTALLLAAVSAAGFLAGQQRASSPGELSTTAALLVGIALTLVLLGAAAAPARKLRTALESSRSWELLAGFGVSVRQFVYGRHLAVEAAKAMFVVASYACFVVSYLLVQDAGAQEWATALLGAGCLVTAATVRLLVIAGGVRNRARASSAPAARGRGWLRPTFLVALIGGLLAVAAWGAGSAAEGDTQGFLEAAARVIGARPGLTAVAAAVLLAGSLAAGLRAHRSLAGLEWVEVWEAVLARRTARISAPALPERPLAAVCAVDGRRLSRSRSERLRPVLQVGVGLPLILLLAGLLVLLTGEEIALPRDVPVTRVTAAGVAFVGYGALVACASMVAMDADRHAFTLWQLIPHGIRTVATARAAQGAIITYVAALFAALAVTAALRLSAEQFFVCLVAGAVMAAFGTVIDLVASLLWPEVEWTETTEIGTSSPGRYASGFIVGIPVVAAIALLEAFTWSMGPGLAAASALALAFLTPLAALLLMRLVVRIAPRRLHA